MGDSGMVAFPLNRMKHLDDRIFCSQIGWIVNWLVTSTNTGFVDTHHLTSEGA
jgi:hypothetical protein